MTVWPSSLSRSTRWVPIYPCWPVTKTFMGCCRAVLWVGGETCGSDCPGGLSGGPQLVQVFEIALRVHTGPEATMLEHTELAVARQANERIALEDATLLRGKIGQEIAVEEEIAAVDPVVNELRLLAELLDPGRLDPQLAEPRGRVHAQDRAEPTL